VTRRQIGGRCWHAGLVEVRRRADHEARTLRDLARGHARIVEPAHPERDVDALFQQIDAAVVLEHRSYRMRQRTMRGMWSC
jgi:hypothetical protein